MTTKEPGPSQGARAFAHQVKEEHDCGNPSCWLDVQDEDELAIVLDAFALKARLEEAKGSIHEYDARPHRTMNPIGYCQQCKRIADLQRQLEERK